MFGAGAFAWSGVVVVCVAFGFICFVLFLFLFFSFFFFSLGIKGGLKLFLAVVQWVGSFGGLSRRLCPYNLTVPVDWYSCEDKSVGSSVKVGCQRGRLSNLGLRQ